MYSYQVYVSYNLEAITKYKLLFIFDYTKPVNSYRMLSQGFSELMHLQLCYPISYYYDKCLTRQLSKKRACFDSKCRASLTTPLLWTHGKAKHVVGEATYLMVVRKRDAERQRGRRRQRKTETEKESIDEDPAQSLSFQGMPSVNCFL